ncbi:hypothetical protein LSTR_LSTR000763 [Laodelphax striatellus]|uniref:Uncharacterized protein n=1 Tax=Laodelphax striatellus TaxID=195883 RepID=A0A482XHL4_LAOST|nr:hypothetical protein LSTR_LSTR000763 [Laodelphax striatellus]
MTSDSDSDIEVPRRKRGKLNKQNHIEEIEKLSRAKGEEFVTHTGFLVEAKKTGPDYGCKKKWGYYADKDADMILSMIEDGNLSEVDLDDEDEEYAEDIPGPSRGIRVGASTLTEADEIARVIMWPQRVRRPAVYFLVVGLFTPLAL